MHYHLEIVMPPTDDIEAAVAQIMTPFNENLEAEESLHPFWDFWVIGGRWAGTKLQARYDAKKLDEFGQWLRDNNITVSGFQCGKQELKPASQIPMVDAKWNEMFPSPTGDLLPCPMFHHSNDQYDSKSRFVDDVATLCTVRQSMPELTCSHIIVAAHGYNSESETWDGDLRAEYMVSDSIWNGVTHVKTWWDGKFLNAVDDSVKRAERYSDGFRSINTPTDDWLAVTVDYHS